MFVAFGVLVVMVLFTALIAPYFIDWTAYKRDFEEQASKIIGQPVTVGGDANVRLLPQPSVSFTKLTVGDQNAGKAMMTVDRFSANVELMPFLSGEIRIVDMALESPVFNIEIDENGKVEWTNRQQALLNPDQVKLDKLSISNAAFNLEGVADGRVIEGRNIQANVSAQSLYGPWQISGVGNVDDVETNFQFSTGRLSDENSIRLKADLRQAGRPYRLLIDGPIKLADSVLSWVGSFSFEPDLVAGKSLAGGKKPLPVHVDGLFSLLPTRLELSEYRIEVGAKEDPFVLTGLGSAQLKGGVDFKLQIDGRQIDIDRLSKLENADDKAPLTLERRLKVVNEILAQIPVPTFKGEIDLEIPAIIAGDTFIRKISALVRPFGEGWEIVRLKSSLPGNTLVEASGRVGSGENFGFYGDILVASRQPSGFSAWAAGKVDPSIRRLKAAGLSANVTLTPAQINLNAMELVLDDNRLAGNIKRLAPVKNSDGSFGNSAIIADLSGNVIRLEDLQAIGSIFFDGKKVGTANDFDVTVRAKELNAFDLDAKDVDLQFQYDEGELSVARLNLGELLGAKIKSTGQISNLLQQPSGNISLNLSAASLQPLLKEVKTRFGNIGMLDALAQQADLTKDSEFVLEIDSKPTGEGAEAKSQNRVILNGKSAETSIRLSGLFDGGLAQPKALWADLSAEFSNPNTETLFKQLGLQAYGFDPIYGGVDQPLKMTVESVGAIADGYSTIISANSDLFSLSAQGVVNPAEGDAGSFDFDVTAGAVDVAPIVTAFGYNLPRLNSVLGDEAPFSSTGKIRKRADGVMELHVDQAQINNNEFSGQLELSNGLAGKLDIKGNLDIDTLSADVLMGLATGQEIEDGLGLLNESEFRTDALVDGNAKLKIKANSADIGLGELAEKVSFDLTYENREYALDNIALNWKNAPATGRLSLANSDGTTVLDCQLYVNKLSLGNVSKALQFPDVVDANSNISIGLNGSGKSAKALIQSLAGNGVLFLEKGRLKGVRPEGLELVLEAADADGFEINSENVEPLARAAFLTDSYEFDETSAPFSISKGSVSFRNIELKPQIVGSARAPIGNLSFDLFQDQFSVDFEVKPDPGKEKISGAEPNVRFTWSGPSSDLALKTDTGALEGFLSIRAFEREQARVETLQASILERQRFRYELLRSNKRKHWIEEREAALERARLAEEARLEAERLAKLEAKRLAEEEAKRVEAERLAIEKAKRLAKLEEERIEAARIEAEKKAAEEAKKAAIRAAEIKARREAEALAAEKAKAAQAEKAKAAQEEAKAAKEEAKAAREAEKIAREQAAAENNNVEPQPDQTSKSGFEVKKLPEPKTDIFQNIEKLLFNSN